MSEEEDDLYNFGNSKGSSIVKPYQPDLLNKNRFIFFGCWNKGGCTRNSIKPNPLEKVISKLKEHLVENEKDKPGFMIVAGDNYYTESNKGTGNIKVKTIINSDLKSGFQCLNTIDIDKKYILLGNHDVDGVNSIRETKESKQVSQVEECPILDFQQKRFKKSQITDKLFTFKNEQLLDHYIDGHTVIIMFDSTILFEIDDAEISNFLSCYNLISTNKFPSIESIITFQNNQRDKTIASLKGKSITNIIFACHHPIVSLKAKIKEGKTKQSKVVTKKMVDFLFPFYETFPEKQFIHLCADVHLFQHSKIKITKKEEKAMVMKIEQYVVGTGGTDLDEPYGQEKIETFEIINPRELLQDIFTEEDSIRPNIKPLSLSTADIKKGAKKCAYPSGLLPSVLVPCPIKGGQIGGAPEEYIITCTIVEEEKKHGFLDCKFSGSNVFTPIFVRVDDIIVKEEEKVPSVLRVPSAGWGPLPSLARQPINNYKPPMDISKIYVPITEQPIERPSELPPISEAWVQDTHYRSPRETRSKRERIRGGRLSTRKSHKKRISKKKNKRILKRTLRKQTY